MRVLLRTLLACAAGVLLALAFEPVAIAVLAPVAVAGFVLTTRALPGTRAWLPGLAFGVGFYFVLIWWMRSVGDDAWIGLAGIESLFYGVLGSVTAVLARRRAWPLWVSAAWVAMESIRSTWPFSGMPWGRLAFSTVDTPWAHALPYLGSTGVSFLLALTGCLLAAVLLPAEGGTIRGRTPAGLGLVACLAVVALPLMAPYQPHVDRQITVAAVQGNVPGSGDDILLDFRQVTQNHVQATIDLADDVAAGRRPAPDFVIWPENSTAVDPFTDVQTAAGIRAASEAVGVPILVGAIVDSGDRYVLNQGIVVDPETGAGDRYTKWHPVPYGEYIPFRRFFSGNLGRLALIPRDMLSGTRQTPLTIAGVQIADAICFDVAYDDGIYAQLLRGGQLLTVQTSNATFIHTSQIEQQFAMSRLRALETGRVVVVASTNGISGIVAADGSVLSQAPVRERAVMLEQIDLSSSITPAVRIGPWFGRLCAALALLGLLPALVPYRRRRHQQAAGDGSRPVPTAPHD